MYVFKLFMFLEEFCPAVKKNRPQASSTADARVLAHPACTQSRGSPPQRQHAIFIASSSAAAAAVGMRKKSIASHPIPTLTRRFPSRACVGVLCPCKIVFQPLHELPGGDRTEQQRKVYVPQANRLDATATVLSHVKYRVSWWVRTHNTVDTLAACVCLRHGPPSLRPV